MQSLSFLSESNSEQQIFSTYPGFLAGFRDCRQHPSFIRFERKMIALTKLLKQRPVMPKYPSVQWNTRMVLPSIYLTWCFHVRLDDDISILIPQSHECSMIIVNFERGENAALRLRFLHRIRMKMKKALILRPLPQTRAKYSTFLGVINAGHCWQR